MTWDGRHLWIADGRKVHSLSTDDGTTLLSLPAPTAESDRPTEMLGLAWQPAPGNRRDDPRGSLWIADRHRDQIFRLALPGGELLDRIPTPGPYPVGLALVDGRLLLLDRDTRTVHRLALDDLPPLVRTDPVERTLVFVHELRNDGPEPVRSAEIRIALPEDLPGQTLHGDPAFSRDPAGYQTDRWGQRIARFTLADLAPGSAHRVTMTVRFTAWTLRHHIDPDAVPSLSGIPADVRNRYTADGDKLDLRDPRIADAARTAVGDERNPVLMVRRLARHVQDHLRYELSGGWNVAPTVLERGTGSCSEYTFVFLALCRAVGIPARYVGALVVRQDDASTDRVFHRWPEVYYPGYGWVPADAQAGDSPLPEKQLDAMMSLENRFLVTTRGGGGSDLLGWTYNYQADWACPGPCRVAERVWSDWRADPDDPGTPSTAAGE